MTSSVSTSSSASSLGAPSGGGGGSGAAGTEPSSSESGAEPPIPPSPAAAVDGAKAFASARLAGDHGPHHHHHSFLGGAAPEQAAAEPTDMNGSAITIREGDAAGAGAEEELDALSGGAPSPPLPLSPVAVAAPKQQAASALSISMQRSRAPLSQQQQQAEQASANAYSPASSFSRSFPDAADAHLVTSSSPALSSNGGHRADSSYDHDHDHEHEHDLDDRASTATRSPPGSPSSLSSWNSYVGGRRGDLADVEDLDLDHHSLGGASGSYTGDGGNAGRWHWHGHHYHHGHGHGDVASHEPELETVPEKEEEASQQQQQQQRAAQHADSTAEHTEDSDDPSLGAASSAFARRSSSGGRARPHHYTGLHRAAPPQAPSASSSSTAAAAAAALPPNSHSHFSTRGLGYVYAQNGLRWSGRPRRKSRVSELGEDGLGLGGAGAGAESPYLHNNGGMASPASSSGTSSPAPELAGALVHPHLSHLHHPSAHPHPHPHHAPLSHATGAGAAEDYITGPPAPPPRSVSPSETIPAVPSRLSLCINAGEEETAVEEDYPSASAAAAVERSGTIKASTSPVRKARPLAPIDARSKSIESNRTIRERSADSTMTASTFSVRSDATDSTLDSASTPATAAGTPTTASSADDVANVVSSASNDLAATSSTCSGSSVSGSSRLSFAANEDDGDGAETDHTAQTSPPSSPPASPAEAKPTPLPRTNPVRKDSSENVTPTSATTTIPAEASMPQRPRRASSGAATKKPLRPCFRRLRSARTDAPRASRDSSSEREWYGYRSSHADDERLRSSVGAAQQEYSQQQAGYAPPQPHPHVRFSQAPPEEVRTHSPNDYDRKSCPISTKLSPEDVEELRYMKMELGLLEAKWRAMSACKLEDSRDNGTWGAGYGSDSSEAVEISFGHTPNHNKLAARERRHTSSMTNTPSPGSSPPLAKRLGDLPPFTTSYSPAHSPSNLSTASNSSHHNPFFRPVSPQLPRVPPSPSAMSENGELPQIDRERALLGATHCPAKLGRRAHAERVCLMSRFGLLDAPPPPLPGTASKSGYMSSSSVPTFGGNDGSYRGNQRFGAGGALGAAGMSTRLGQRGYNDGANTPVAQAPGGASVRSTSLTRTNSGRSSSAPPRSRSGEPGPQLLQEPELELSARRLLTQQSSGDLRSSAGPGYDDIESAIAASEGTGASTPEATPRGRSTANKGLGAGPGPGLASPPLPRSPSLDVSSTAIPRVALKSPSPPPERPSEAFAVAPAPTAAGGKQQRPAPVPLQKTNSSGAGGSGGKTYRASPVASSSGSSPAIATPPLRSPFDTEQEEERELESPALTTPTATTSRPLMLLSTSPPKAPSPVAPVKAPPPPPEPSSSRPKPKGLPSFSPACATRPYAHSSSHAPRPYAATSSYSSYAASSPAASPGGHLAGKPWTGGMAPRPTSIYGSMGMGAGNGYGHGSPGGAGTAAVTAAGGSMPGFGGGGGGYDSPASEFYESGSEYDLLG